MAEKKQIDELSTVEMQEIYGHCHPETAKRHRMLPINVTIKSITLSFTLNIKKLN